MLKGDETVLIAYGSQTGNAQDLAERIWRRVRQQKQQQGHVGRVELSTCDSLDMNKLIAGDDDHRPIVFICVCSTCGQGDVPDNMGKFWRSIMHKSISPGFLANLRFACVGLGDSTYPKFNFTAKKLFKRLVQLGAQPLTELCLCDEQDKDGSTEAGFARWSKLIFGSSHEDASSPFFTRFRITDDTANTQANEITNTSRGRASEVDPLYGLLVCNERVTSRDHWQDVRLIEIECGENIDRVRYDCGDVCVMQPSNIRANVDKFLSLFEHLKLDLQKSIKIESNFVELQPEAAEMSRRVRTIGDLVEHYLDINSIPRMSFFELFATMSDDELEKEKLVEFTTTADGLDDLTTYCYRPRRTILEVFADFTKTTRRIESVAQLLDLVPSIKPRSFSIASSPCLHESRIQLLVAVVEYKTRLFETRKGTCSYWLSTLREGARIPIWTKKGSFQIDNKRPIICIGPGTGVAPFRSIINERVRRLDLTNNYLYFGCRSRHKDYYFESEWAEMSARGQCAVCAAFSRDQPDDRKEYVQDLLWRDRDDVFRLLDQQQCLVLIAGNSKRMPDDVMAYLERIVQHGLRNLHDVQEDDCELKAKSYVKKLEIDKRIQLETWS